MIVEIQMNPAVFRGVDVALDFFFFLEDVTLNRYQVAKIATGLSQLKIRFLRPDGQVRDFRVQSGLGPTGDDPKAVNNDGKKMSVQQYFRYMVCTKQANKVSSSVLGRLKQNTFQV